VKAIIEPSGLQVGCVSEAVGTFVSWTSEPPNVLTKISLSPVRSLANASFCPSGEYAGSMSLAVPKVSGAAEPEPSAGTLKMSKTPSAFYWNAMRCPSGDHAGFSPPAAVRTSCGSTPSGFTTPTPAVPVNAMRPLTTGWSARAGSAGSSGPTSRTSASPAIRRIGLAPTGGRPGR
jgi:hypothetical protein